MHTRRCILYVLFAATLAAQTVQVAGDVKQPLTLSLAELAKLPRASVKTSSHGVETQYEGVLLHEILKQAGVPNGKELRGKALSTYIVATATDGYQVLFSLAELDPSFLPSGVLLADTANGKPLSGAQGRFRLVAPKDGPGARSIRMLAKIEVVQVRK